MFICVTPFIRHQKYTVSSSAQQSIILSGIKKAGLLIRGFGRQCYRYMITIGGKVISGIRHKLCKRNTVFGKNIFKINIDSLKSLFLNGHKQIGQKILLDRFIVYQRGNKKIVELSVRAKGRQCQDRRHSLILGSKNHKAVIKGGRN